MDPRSLDITSLLAAAGDGDAAAANRLLEAIYDDLRHLARRELDGDRRAATLEPTALVNEAYQRLVGGSELGFESRAHFFGSAARAMRRIVIERARRAAAEKRGSGRAPVDFDERTIACDGRARELVQLDDCLDELQRVDARKAEVVMLRFFGGLEVREIAAALEIAESTVKLDWNFARAWLRRRLDQPVGER